MAGMKRSVGLGGLKVLKDCGFEYYLPRCKESHWQNATVCGPALSAAWSGTQNGCLGTVLYVSVDTGPAWLEGQMWSEISGLWKPMGSERFHWVSRMRSYGRASRRILLPGSGRPQRPEWGSLLSLWSPLLVQNEEGENQWNLRSFFSSEILRIYQWAKVLEIKKCAFLTFIFLILLPNNSFLTGEKKKTFQ